jgi:heptosyltransferase I
MQANLRINMLYPALHAPIKIGFDRTRAREGQWLFCNRTIPFKDEHLLDSFLSFIHLLGCKEMPAEWHLPIPADELTWAHNTLSKPPRPLIAIHPCASKAERNWPIERLKEFILAAKQKWACEFVFTGGNNSLELETCSQLAKVASNQSINLCGRTTPTQLAALLGKVDVLIAPDTAAVHLARAMNTPVIGLYAVAPPALSGPYQRSEFIVDKYPEAVHHFLKQYPLKAKWNTRVHHPQAMECIEVEDVLQQLSKVLADGLVPSTNIS